MRYTRLQKGEDVSSLARRLFGAGSKEAARKAEEMLLRANPSLRHPGGVKEDTPIVVPETAGPEALGRAEGNLNLVDALLRAAREQLGDLSQVVGDRLERQAEANKNTQALLKLAQVRRMVERDPEAREAYEAVREQTQQEAKEIEQRRKEHEEAFAELAKDLDDFLGTKGDSPGRRDK